MDEIDTGSMAGQTLRATEDTCARAPVGLLAELTHRCPLQCPYCSNPLELEAVNHELTTTEWQNVLRQARELGILQLHLSGGEPCVRQDLEQILAVAVECGLYSNLITSGVTLSRRRLELLTRIGLDHVQLSIQDTDPENAERICGYAGGSAKKADVAAWVKELGLPLTLNAVIHRHNIENLENIIEYALGVGASRLEVAHTQYYAWALKNRAALIPTREQFLKSVKIVEDARQRLKGILAFDFVVHDHYAVRPKPCMGGWGRSLMTVTPSGRVLPCHAAQTISWLKFDNVRERPLADIWLHSQAFQAYRGTNWMKEPCQSCDRREIDWGGCRCQALAMTGDAQATDPTCSKSDFHAAFRAVAEKESREPSPQFTYRRMRSHILTAE